MLFVMDSSAEIRFDEIDREQIERARRMPPLEKFLAGARLFDYSCELMTAGIRRQFPDADDDQVANILRQRLALAKRLEAHP